MSGGLGVSPIVDQCAGFLLTGAGPGCGCAAGGVAAGVGLTAGVAGRGSGRAGAGCSFTGAGCSMVFPSLGVEAVRGVSVVNRGSVLGIFTAFFDLALGVSGPVAGVIVTHKGYSAVFLFAAAMALIALSITYGLYRREPRLGDALEEV